MGNLARHYHLAGRREDALRLWEEALTRSRDINGPEHPATLTAMSGVAESWLGANRRDEALTLMEEVVTIRRKVSGPRHPDTRSALRRLTALCRENGDDARAKTLETEAADGEGAPEPK